MRVYGTHRAKKASVALAFVGVALASAACGGSAKPKPTPTPLPCASGQTGVACPPPPSTPTPTPPGLPSDWSSRAIQAATTKLTNCAQATSLNPDGCPNQVLANSSTVEAVHWTVLNGPLADAVAVPSQPSDSGGAGGAGQVDVYGLYQMDVSYTVPGQGIRPYLDYTGGIAHATMSWDGTSFQNVQISTGAAGDQPPPGVSVPPFTRPPQATDAAVLAAVKAGFHDCDTIHFPPTSPQIPNCPYTPAGVFQYATSAQFTPNSDPTQGALVSFDTQHGNFAVTGSYNEKLNYTYSNPNPNDPYNGPHTVPVTGQYTATVVWDGAKIQLVKIAGS